MTIKIVQKNNQLFIHNLSTVIVDRLKIALSIKDPTYITMQRMGKPVWWMKEYIEYFTYKDGVFMCGRGCLDGIIEHLKKVGEEYELVDERVLPKLSRKYKSIIQLRDYQGDVFKDIQGHEQGILKLSTGFGKSVIALKLFENLETPTLIVVPKSHLLKQYEKDIKTFFGKDTPIGIIQGEKKEIKDITLATIQTLSNRAKNGDLNEIRDGFGAVVIDECHEFITRKRLKVIQSFNPTYLYGLSGTPERTDQQDKAIIFTFGRIISEHELPQQPPKIKVIKSDIKIPVMEYADMIECMVESVDRNLLIADIAKQQIKEGRRTLVLTKRIRHVDALCEAIEGSTPIYAKMDDKAKEELFKSLREGAEFTCLIGTYALLGTGSDIPSLDTLIFAGDIRSHVLSRQSIGRILRLFEGKKDPLVIDICDNLNGVLHNQFKSRRAMYNKHGWEIIN